MTTADVRPRAAGRGAAWAVLVGGLTLGLIVGPGALAGPLSGTHLSIAQLPSTVAEGFARWVQSGTVSSAPLAPAVSFWAAFHVIKAALALALLLVLALVARRVWGAHAWSQTRNQRKAPQVAGLVSVLAMPFLVLMVMANVQGVVAPLSSVLTFLPMHGSAVAEVQAQLAAGRMSPALTTLVDDFRRYHAALVVTAVVAIIATVAATVVVWKRRMRTPHTQTRLRRLTALGGTMLPVVVLFLVVVMLANVSTVTDTAPALAAFFDGSGT